MYMWLTVDLIGSILEQGDVERSVKILMDAWAWTTKTNEDIN